MSRQIVLLIFSVAHNRSNFRIKVLHYLNFYYVALVVGLP